ncbi:hypothetical protein ACHQM5_028598 [Ranunculus cassubicifolius]
MEPEPSAKPRKVRFAPKIPKSKPKPTLPKIEKKEEVDALEADLLKADLLKRINERGKPKFNKNAAPVQVAFGQGTASSFIKSYGPPRNKASRDGGGESVQKVYKEPWDYYTYYPMTLPLRRPYAGNPVVLDEQEFGEGADNAYDENYTNQAEELGLMDGSSEEQLIFLQLPSSLPFMKRPASAEANEAKPMSRKEKDCKLEELPAGKVGKLLVYKSGAVKLKLGEMLYDVSPGSDNIFAQDVVAVNTQEKHCCVIGELNKLAIVSPDIDSLLKDISDLS